MISGQLIPIIIVYPRTDVVTEYWAMHFIKSQLGQRLEKP